MYPRIVTHYCASYCPTVVGCSGWVVSVKVVGHEWARIWVRGQRAS